MAYQNLGLVPPLNTNLEERAAMLAKTYWSKVYSPAELLTIASYLVAFEVSQGANVIQEGADAAFMFLLVSGKMEVFKKDTSGQDKLLASVNAGMTLGEMSLIDGRTRSSTVVATEDSLLLIFSKEKFQRLVNNEPKLALKLFALVASQLSLRLRQTSGELADYILYDTFSDIPQDKNNTNRWTKI